MPAKPGGINEKGTCPKCLRTNVELLRVECYGRMCSPCVIRLARGER